MEAPRSGICVGLTPDQGKRIRYQAIVIAAMAGYAPPRLHAILDGQPEGIIQFHELSGVGSIGDEKRGDLMAGFTKAPFYGAAYVKRGLVKGVALMSRASTQPRVEYVCGLLQDAVANIARSMPISSLTGESVVPSDYVAMAQGDGTPNPVTFDDLRRKLGGIAKQKAPGYSGNGPDLHASMPHQFHTNG